ncbi:MAG TPA: acyl-CoA dehydrogenase family protein [Thermoanaerobaculia bacterium]|jgi:alkylation response protein AidB-like acyl-CoA dehydrogenase
MKAIEATQEQRAERRAEDATARSEDSASSSGAADFSAELDVAAQALEQALEKSDFDIFFDAFRRTSLPWIGIEHRHEPGTAFRRTAEVVQRLGSISPALALAVENHFYPIAAIATLPTSEDDVLDERRTKLVDSVRRNRWLVANSNSRVHGDRIAQTGTVVKPVGGRYRIAGRAAYMSLATASDLIVFVTFFETGEPAIFFCPSKDNPRLEIGPLLFPDAMQDSDTRRITYHDLELTEDNLLASARDGSDMLGILHFEMIWHQSLLAALSLGTAARAIEEGRLFLRTVKQGDGTPLARLDGMVVDMGRQVLRYRAACGALELAAKAVTDLCAQPLTPHALLDAFEIACAAKYAASGCAEDIVGVVRRIIGARTFAGGHPMERLSREVLFAPLGGDVNAYIERRAGERVLGESSFLSTTPPPSRSRSKVLANIQTLARARKATLKKKDAAS